MSATMLAAELESEIRWSAEEVGMPPSRECPLKEGTLEDGGIWVEPEPGLGRKQWVKRRWTVEIAGRRYAVGQDREHRVIAYAEAGKEGVLTSLGGMSTWGVRYALLAVVLAVWSVLGLVFWIPLLVRATFIFCVGALYTNLTARRPPTVPSRELQHATGFYISGFRSIYHGVIEPLASEPSSTPAFDSERLTTDVLGTVLFWWVALLGLAYFGVAATSYLDQLLYPIVWAGEKVSWLIEQFSLLLDEIAPVLP